MTLTAMTDDRLCGQPAEDWRETLDAGHVVVFRFPLAEGDGTLPGKPRPCVVLDVVRGDGAARATVVYGTSADTRANTGLEIHVIAPRALEEAGVRRPTRFVGARRITVDLDDGRFDVGPEGTPVLGRLDAEGHARLAVVRGKLAGGEPCKAGRSRRRRSRRARHDGSGLHGAPAAGSQPGTAPYGSRTRDPHLIGETASSGMRGGVSRRPAGGLVPGEASGR